MHHVNPVNNTEQKGVLEHDRYAKRSLAFSFISPCLLFVLLWLLGWLTKLSIHFNSEVAGYIVIIGYPLAIINSVVLLIFGVIFGKKGLKSSSVRVAKAGLILSIIELLLLIFIAIVLIICLFANGW
jgi:hypothetical protein